MKVHIGKKSHICEKLFVHEKNTKEAHEVKYLGDILNEPGNPKATISERINRGQLSVAKYLLCSGISR